MVVACAMETRVVRIAMRDEQSSDFEPHYLRSSQGFSSGDWFGLCSDFRTEHPNCQAGTHRNSREKSAFFADSFWNQNSRSIRCTPSMSYRVRTQQQGMPHWE